MLLDHTVSTAAIEFRPTVECNALLEGVGSVGVALHRAAEIQAIIPEWYSSTPDSRQIKKMICILFVIIISEMFVIPI
jgi:hypothetical protein